MDWIRSSISFPAQSLTTDKGKFMTVQSLLVHTCSNSSLIVLGSSWRWNHIMYLEWNLHDFCFSAFAAKYCAFVPWHSSHTIIITIIQNRSFMLPSGPMSLQVAFTQHSRFSFTNIYPFDAHCCHMGTAIKYSVPDQVKPSLVIFDIRALWRSGSVWYRILYSCAHMATYGYMSSLIIRAGRSVSIKSATGLSYLSIITSVYPASNGEQAITRVGRQ